MFEIIMLKVIPINLVFLIGVLLKKLNVMTEEDGKGFLKFAFYVLIPAMLFNSMNNMIFSWEILTYPLLIVIIQGVMYFIGRLLYKGSEKINKERAVTISSLMVMNTGFIIPFFTTFFGQEEVWRIGIFDFGNALITFSITYSIFLNDGKKSKKIDYKRILKVFQSPPVIAILIGILVNTLRIEVPETINILTENLSLLVGPMIMMALGLYFNPKIEGKKMALIIVVTKFVIGALIATGLSQILNLDNTTKAIVYLMACSPVGTNILTFSMLTKSNMNFVSGVVSLSTVMNLFLTPLLLIILTS